MAYGPIFTWSGPTIPSTATILGVQVILGYLAQSSTTANIANVSLYNAGSAIGTAKSPALGFTSSVQIMNEGTNTDLWGATLTPAILNSGTFGFGVQVYIASTRVFVQNAYITVFYHS
jgi:hypothetical protein